ncbi:hypothetical protein EJB05_15730, partial [Eragrostis curvula]
MAWDMARHEIPVFGRAQGTKSTGLVELPVFGSINQYAGWPYLTRLQIGNPPTNFTLLIDTGSDTMWVSCTPCSGCPTSGLVSIDFSYFIILLYRHSYNPKLSSSSSVIACSDDWCHTSERSGFASCDASDNHSRCGYNIMYGSGSTVGYYVSDQVSFDIIGDNVKRFSSSIIFGCSTMQSGGLAETNEFDGIVGIGPNQESPNSQLNSKGIAPLVFSLCLSTTGNGILILGEAVEPGIVYTPLVPSRNYYKLYLESIAVNGQTLRIDSSVFETSPDRGTIVDSGTTLAYLADKAYDPFVDAIVAAVSPSVHPIENNGDRCFLTSSSLASSFPDATLHFVGGAVMTVKPQNYLLSEVNMLGGQSMFCLGWKRKQGSQQITILGDIIISNKLIVHDLDNMRLGWVEYNCKLKLHLTGLICSQPVNVTTTHRWRKRHENSGHRLYTVLTPSAIILMLTHMLIFGI